MSWFVRVYVPCWRTTVPLANATDIALWACRRESQDQMPRLISRLVLGSGAKVKQISFPSDESVQSGGWDGTLVTDGSTAFVPAGASGWEIGVTAGVKGKADDDYDKRTANPLALDRANATFVFVTPRKWSNKEEWAEEKRASGAWQDVHVVDADDIALWLEQTPT